MVQPLIDAGLELAEIHELVVQLAFEDIVTEGRGTVARTAELVADRSPAVQAAWAQTISRMLTLEFPP